MPPFRILEHTADIGFEAFGASREEVFANAARALVFLMFEPGTIMARQELAVEVEGPDAASLLVNWLSEILFQVDAEGWVFADFALHELTEQRLRAKALGEPLDPSRHQAKLQVKAITYHQLSLEQIPDGWRAQVYVDI